MFVNNYLELERFLTAIPTVTGSIPISMLKAYPDEIKLIRLNLRLANNDYVDLISAA
jgi:hypothetical protein